MSDLVSGLGFGLVILVLVLRIWSCLHNCCFYGMGFYVSRTTNRSILVLLRIEDPNSGIFNGIYTTTGYGQL